MPMPSYVNERPVKTGCWTEREDELLAEWQGKYGNRWCMVAKKIPGRTGQQCAQRWRHKVNPNIKKEKWTIEEDEKLLVLYEEHGGSWAQISRHLEGRTDQQCMGRWKRHLDPTITREAWTDAEDATLHDQFEMYGSQWSSIARMLPGRTAQQCRARWFQIGGATKSGRKPSVRSRQARDDESGSDDGTAYQNEDPETDVDLSAEEDGNRRGSWDDDDEEDEEEDIHWSPHVATPKAPRTFARGPSSGHRSGHGHSFNRTLSQCRIRPRADSNFDSPVSAAGSNAGAFNEGLQGDGSLEYVEEADIAAGEILTTLKASPSPIRRARCQSLVTRASLKQQHELSAAWRHSSTGASTAAERRDSEAGAGPLQQPLHHAASAPEQTLYSPRARRPYTNFNDLQDLDQQSEARVRAVSGVGVSSPQTPRTMSRLAAGSPGGWARSPSVPIMAMLQSPQAPDSDAFLRSPSSFQGLVTPDWSKKLTQQKADPQTCPPPTQGWTPSRLGGADRAAGKHTVARRLNVDQALKGAGQLSANGLAPLTVPQATQQGEEGQGTDATRQEEELGSPAKKMRISSVFSQHQEGSASARLQQYIAARQQSRQSGTPDSTAAANSAFSSYTAAAGLQIQPLCLAGSPTAASSPMIASSGRFPAETDISHHISHHLPGSMQGSAAHTHLFLPGSKTRIGFGSRVWSQMGSHVPKQAEAAQQSELQLHAQGLLAGSAYSNAKLEPFRPLPDKENSACRRFFEMTMGRQQSSSYAEAASVMTKNGPKFQQDAVAASQGMPDGEICPATAVARDAELANVSTQSSGKLERESSQGSAARRMKLHAMLDNL